MIETGIPSFERDGILITIATILRKRQRQANTVILNGNSLEPGMYLYTLVIDGKEVDTKRMILTK